MAGDEAVRVGAMDSEGKVMEHSTQALEDQLQETVMAKLEDILVKHENDLWRRGQEAIAQLQPDRKKVMSCLQELQTRQAELMAQQEEMSRELLGISSKLDWFVGECTQAMSGLGSSEPLDIRDVYAGTEGVPNGFDDILVDSSGGQALPPLLLSGVTPPSGSSPEGRIPDSARAQDVCQSGILAELGGTASFPPEVEGPRTPPRQSPAILSLASALTPLQTPPPERRGPPRLSLAAHLDDKETKLPKLRADAPAFVPGEACG
ncbi:unnamed protein product [Effrenium voratum]|uniref:Uncharacterized protein n=2 Tax=Effrenium voratum TaxID=2562239 RepID=A0AA36IJN6_9DINO|nr:unnamed protein product [Effrenium voratum]CAJ1448961.1 unnamed protein product [Effrenium voratum]